MTDRNELAERIEALRERLHAAIKDPVYEVAASPLFMAAAQLLGKCRDEIAALRAPALTSEEEIARVLYDLDPYEECGEYIDGHQISPGGALTWRQACMRDAEFADDPLMLPITKSAREAARAVFALIGKTGGEK